MIKEIKPTRVARIDGPSKVTGTAKYTSDYNFPNLTYAVPVCAKIAKGTLTAIDVTAAKKIKGVIDIYTHQTIGPLYRPTFEPGMDYRADENRPPLEDTEITYYGQYIAVVIAESFEIAQHAAKAVKATYKAEKPNLDLNYKQEDLKKVESERGSAKDIIASAPAKISNLYTTPIEVHNPIELHSSVAYWTDNDHLVLYEATQAVVSVRNVVAQVLGVAEENVQVISKFIGSGFGGKAWMWPHCALAAAAARKIKRPVKLVIDRHMAFTNVGHRARTHQQMSLASDRNGQLQALTHDYSSQAAIYSEYKENCGEVSGLLYKIPAVKVTSGVARRNQSVQTSMRGPGAVPGSFALESALDELAIELKMDPVQLRIANDVQEDQNAKKPFSSRYLKECLETGATKFGWSKRNAKVGSMRDGEEILGWGVAGCTWHAGRIPANVTFKFLNTGRVHLSCGTHDLGTGMYTVLAQMVTNETGIDFSKIDIEIGDSKLPKGPLAGGSLATASVVPAVLQAIRAAIKNMKTTAIKTSNSPLKGKKEEDITFANGKFSGTEFGALLKKLNKGSIEGRGSSKANGEDPEAKNFSVRSFGAHFVEVGWNPEIAKLRVRRVVSVIDAGRIINFRPAQNQIEGAVIMGIGMAMMEEALYDSRDGNCVNSNLADYVMAVHADCPDMSVTFLDYPDKVLNEYGSRGIGEIGLAGTAAAITNAVYHATGVRVRELPVTIEKLLKVNNA